MARLVASGAPAGSGRGGRGVTQGSGVPQPATVDVDKIGARLEGVGHLFQEAEDAVVNLRSAEASRATLYDQSEQALADKFGIGGER